MRQALTIVFLFFFMGGIFCQAALSKEKVSKNPYYKYVLNSTAGKVTYYVSEFNEDKKLPLVVYIQGSGYHSLFAQNGQSIHPTSGHINLPYLCQDKAKVLIIEKPGVEFLDKMLPNERNTTFDQVFSLETWTERIEQVIDLVIRTEIIDSTKIMLIGHSEGGLVAARVAKMMNGSISNVCIMAGEGPSQLYSLYSFAASGDFFNEISDDEKERTGYVLETWDNIRNDSASTDKFFWGFTYLRWHSFLKTSVIEELEFYKGAVLILQGDEDKNVSPEASKILFTSLLSKGINVKLKMLKGADHSFNIKESDINGWKQALESSLDWFL